MKNLNDLVLVADEAMQAISKSLTEVGYDSRDPAVWAALFGIVNGLYQNTETLSLIKENVFGDDEDGPVAKAA